MHTRRAVKAVAVFVVAVYLCRRFGFTILSPFWLSPFWLYHSVAVLAVAVLAVAVVVCRCFDDTPKMFMHLAYFLKHFSKEFNP